ncbi:TPA: hypothetical protein SMF87_004570 [Serratia marcescens]|nr:hypothetical protein [Serratia marcescens]
MQTLAAKASRLLAWEQIDLSNGVYRVLNARWITNPPDFTGWVDCSGTQQLRDEVSVALNMLGEEMTGLWIGMGNTMNGVCHGVAWAV